MLHISNDDAKEIIRAMYHGIDDRKSLIDSHSTSSGGFWPGYENQIKGWNRDIATWRELRSKLCEMLKKETGETA